MSLRRVRCPHCAGLFDATGIATGTRLRCGGCSQVLRIPAFPAPRPLPLIRISAFSLAGLVTIVVLVLALRPASQPSIGAPSAAPALARETAGASEPKSGLGIIDDPISRLRQELAAEFPASRFTISDDLRPYAILLESCDRYVAAERIREYAHHLELAQTIFRRDVAERIGLPEVKDALLPLLVLATREKFDRHCERRMGKRQPATTKGIYDYIGRRIVTYQDAVVSRDMLLHEGAHQLMHYYQSRLVDSHKVHLSFWLQEGLANYCEGFRRRIDGEVALDRASEGGRFPLLRHVASSRDRSEFIPLARLVELTVDDYWVMVDRLRLEDPGDADRKAQIHYAESWALVHFLRQSGPAYRRVFEICLRRELEGTGTRKGFEDVVRRELDLTVAVLEDQFVKYLRALK
jgi:hypothetical protein